MKTTGLIMSADSIYGFKTYCNGAIPECFRNLEWLVRLNRLFYLPAYRFLSPFLLKLSAVAIPDLLSAENETPLMMKGSFILASV